MTADKIRVTRHAAERWRERIEPECNAKEVEARIRAAFEAAEELCAAEDDAKAYLYDGIILIVTADNAVATVYRPEYGFGDEIDRQVTTALIQKLREARSERRRLAKEAAPKLQALETELRAVRDEIERLQTRERRLQLERERVLEEGRELALQEEGIAHRLYQSVHYRIELLAGKHSKVS